MGGSAFLRHFVFARFFVVVMRASIYTLMSDETRPTQYHEGGMGGSKREKRIKIVRLPAIACHCLSKHFSRVPMQRTYDSAKMGDSSCHCYIKCPRQEILTTEDPSLRASNIIERLE